MGSARTEHRFQYSAELIARAALAEAEYHQDRLGFWQHEYTAAAERVRATAGIALRAFQVTGGERIDVVVDYGDPAAYKRMQEAWAKMVEHRHAEERYHSDAAVYQTQADRAYELDLEDVRYFRLGGEARPE